MLKPKFIGTVGLEDVGRTFDPICPWRPLAFAEIPYPVVKYARNYMFTLGSGCYSAPTTSIFRQEYISGIDVFRQDVENGQVIVDIDHYIASPMENSFAIFKEPAGNWHRLLRDDKRLDYVEDSWRYYIRDILEGKIKF